MKKLKLELNDLKIESFETGKTEKEKGTIQGQADTYTEAYPTSCFPESTCVGGSCDVGGCHTLPYCTTPQVSCL